MTAESNPAGDAGTLSASSKYLLYVAGASFILFGTFVAFATCRALSAVLKLFSSGTSVQVAKSKKSEKTSLKTSPQNGGQRTAAATSAATAAAAAKGPDLKTLIKDAQRAQVKKGSNKDESASHHPLFVNTLKGHGDVVHGISWSSDGQQMTTACEDMYVRVFDLSDVTSREPKFWRIKTPRTPIGAGFADSKGLKISVVMRGIPDTLMAVYESVAGKNGAAATVEELWQAGNIHGKDPALTMRAVSPSGRPGIIASLSTKKDLKVYNVQGREVGVLEPNSLGNHDLAVSLDGRFIAVASFTSEVKIWEVKVARESGEVTGIFKAMELKGHKKKVMSVALSPDNRRAVTVSQDGTLRVWNIDVRYAMSEDPKTLLTIAMPLSSGRCYQRLALSSTGVIAASSEGIVHLISSSTGDLLDSIDAHEGSICELHWSPVPIKVPGQAEPLPVLATCGRDKRVRMWRCP